MLLNPVCEFEQNRAQPNQLLSREEQHFEAKHSAKSDLRQRTSSHSPTWKFSTKIRLTPRSEIRNFKHPRKKAPDPIHFSLLEKFKRGWAGRSWYVDRCGKLCSLRAHKSSGTTGMCRIFVVRYFCDTRAFLISVAWCPLNSTMFSERWFGLIKASVSCYSFQLQWA